MSIVRLKKAYKIHHQEIQKYSKHYNIPSESCLVVPMKDFGDDVSCDVRWEDTEGLLHIKEDLFFKKENLERINPMDHTQLQEIWVHYYTHSPDFKEVNE
jgi:hypothetical protein